MPLTYAQPFYQQSFTQLLSENGDGTGAVSITGNYSITPKTFSVTPHVTQKLIITELFVSMVDNGGLTFNGYGSGAALTNGLLYTVQSNGSTGIILPIKSNADLQLFATQYGIYNYSAGADGMKLLFNLTSFGFNGGVILDGNKGDFVKIVAQDDFSFLERHEFGLNGAVI